MNDLGKAGAKVLEIGPDSAGQRLDNFLHKVLKGAPSSLVYRIIRSGEVRVNKGRARPETRLAADDRVRVPPLALDDPGRHAAAGAARAGGDLHVLFEDDALLAIDKPSGVAVHGGSGLAFGVIEALRAARPQATFLELAHRLDRDTSGVLLLAKKRAMLVAVHALIREHRVDKRYLALARGRWPHAAKHHLTSALKSRVVGGERRVAATDEADMDAKDAHSVVSVARRFADATLLEVQLRTGRTHQIRVHLAAAGHPIVGDDKYGDPEVNRAASRAGFRRMFLHAAKISFVRPDDGTRLRLEAPLPDDCSTYLRTLAPLPRALAT
ncbi:MAG: RluA family pseudouridine synthase [Burkholderiales bacterium]|nr:RluA family pseudouridine synthase [Burkholderiales bacterium]